MKHGVYLIADEAASLVKIGQSSDPISRLDALQIGSANRLTLLYWMPIDDRHKAFRLERALHHAFQSKRAHGEWFALTNVDVEGILGAGVDAISYDPQVVNAHKAVSTIATRASRQWAGLKARQVDLEKRGHLTRRQQSLTIAGKAIAEAAFILEKSFATIRLLGDQTAERDFQCIACESAARLERLLDLHSKQVRQNRKAL